MIYATEFHFVGGTGSRNLQCNVRLALIAICGLYESICDQFHLGNPVCRKKKNCESRKSLHVYSISGIMYKQQTVSKNTSPCFRFQPFHLRVSLSLNSLSLSLALSLSLSPKTKYLDKICQNKYVHISCR